jgi:hypothetical protein
MLMDVQRVRRRGFIRPSGEMSIPLIHAENRNHPGTVFDRMASRASGFYESQQGQAARMIDIHQTSRGDLLYSAPRIHAELR